jgi:hypothetical protein
VLDTIRIWVDALVQSRGSTQRKREEKRRREQGCDKNAPPIIRGRSRVHRAASL